MTGHIRVPQSGGDHDTRAHPGMKMTPNQPRYALYYAPSTDSPLWQAGCTWLGRDPESGRSLTPPAIAGMPSVLQAALTESARRYGFHATLKAPFTLANGFDETHLLDMARAFSATQCPVAIDSLHVAQIDGYLALGPASPVPDINALAMRCVTYFDPLRAPLSDAELARRRRAGLSAREEQLLLRWGYPYTEEVFRFHMTLTDLLDRAEDGTGAALRAAAEAHFKPVVTRATPMIDGLAVFREPAPGAPFELRQRFAFAAHDKAATLPAPGRLFYLVGPSGVGKDSLLHWVRTQLDDPSQVEFARRTITRTAHPSEDHESISEPAFWEQAAEGRFAMVWQANGTCYGIRRSIEAALLSGRDVVVNGSREYASRVHQVFPDARIVWITADTATIERRLQARQREHGAALLQRMHRVAQFPVPDHASDVIVDNSGPLHVAGTQILDLLRR